MTREIDRYELEVEVHGPYYHDRFVVEADDLLRLKPRFVNRGDVLFERYDVGDDWHEIRVDHVIARRLKVVYRQSRENDDVPRARRFPSIIGEEPRDGDVKRGETHGH